MAASHFVCPFHQLGMWASTLAIVNDVVNICSSFLCVPCKLLVFFSMYLCLQRELLDHLVRPFNFLSSCQAVCQTTVPVTIPLASCEGAVFRILPALVTACLLVIALLVGVRWDLTVVSKCISLVT